MSVCHTTLVGRIGAVSVKAVGPGLTELRVAVSHSRWNEKRRDWDEETDWHTVNRWHREGRDAPKHAVGDLVYVQGTGRIECWENSDGEKRYSFKVQASTVRCLQRFQPEDQAETTQGDRPRSYDGGGGRRRG